MPCVYILRSQKTQKHYTGSSHEDEPTQRLKRHNSGQVKSTKSGLPWSLIHLEYFENYSLARKREIFLKTGKGREWIKLKFSEDGFRDKEK